MVDITVGIDMATEPSGRGACIIRWGVEGPEVTIVDRAHPELDLANLVELTNDLMALKERASRFVVGIDVPLGWPSTFVAALTNPSGNGSSTDGNGSFDGAWEMNARDLLCSRQTDRILGEVLAPQEDGPKPPRPLRVAADRIGATAMSMRALELQLASKDFVFDRSGGLSSNVVEVYPAASLFAWGIPATGYKTSKDFKANRERIFDALTACASPEKRASLLGKLKRSIETKGRDHDLDAFVCALTARVVQLQGTYDTRHEEVAWARLELKLDEASFQQVAEEEGWIHVPRGPETLTALWKSSAG